MECSRQHDTEVASNKEKLSVMHQTSEQCIPATGSGDQQEGEGVGPPHHVRGNSLHYVLSSRRPKVIPAPPTGQVRKAAMRAPVKAPTPAVPSASYERSSLPPRLVQGPRLLLLLLCTGGR